MIKPQKNTLVFLTILFQSVTAIILGFIAIYLSSSDRVPPNTYVASVQIGGLEKSAAADKLKSYCRDSSWNKPLTIKIENTSMEYKLKLDEIGVQIDFEATVEAACGPQGGRSLDRLVLGFLFPEKRMLNPVVRINELKLKDELKALSESVFRAPANAQAYLRDNKIIKEPEVNGIALNIENTVERIKRDLGNNSGDVLMLREEDRFELEVVKPEITLDMMEGIRKVISRYSTEIKSAENLDSIKSAVRAVNKVLILPADPEKGKKAGEFSFNKYLNKAGLIKEQNDEGYNQVASTLHGALLFAGIPGRHITKVPHTNTVDYIEPGLDVKVFGNIEDFKFKNSLDCPLIIFAEVKGNTVEVSIAGDSKGDSLVRGISIDVIEKRQPGIISIETSELKPGEKKIISPGRDGISVNVYLEIDKAGEKTERKFIYAQTYSPIDALQHVGVDKSFGNASDK
ncbi:MAG: VanW family protein [Clostridia bacterium]|nr:VanW family protein [Clostridia bacterium]